MKRDRFLPYPNPLLNQVLQQELAASRQEISDSLQSGKLFKVAAQMYCFLEHSDSRNKTNIVIVKGPEALDKGLIKIQCREGSRLRQGSVPVSALLGMVASYEGGHEIRILDAKCPGVATGKEVVFWDAIGYCLWYCRRIRVAYFSAWDYRNIALALLDADFGRQTLKGSVSMKELILRRPPGHEKLLVNKCKDHLSEGEMATIVSGAVTNALSRDDGGVSLHGIFHSGDRAVSEIGDFEPDWSKTDLPDDERWMKANSSVVRELRHEVFGCGIHSDRSEKEFLHYEESFEKSVSPMVDERKIDVEYAKKSLTARECKVYELLAQGHTSAEIGRLLGISRQRVDQLREKVIDRLKNRLRN